MNILYVHERATFFGGVEQNIVDTTKALRRHGIQCHLAYDPAYPSDTEFLHYFDSAHHCTELSETNSKLPRNTLLELARKTKADCIYLHKLNRLPESFVPGQFRTVQMVHDHDLCCPRKHKYFAHNNRVCNGPAGWRCYLDAAFLQPKPQSLLKIGYCSIGGKLKEMRRRQSLDTFLVASEFMRTELTQNGFLAEKIQVLPLAVNAPVRVSPPPVEPTPMVLFVGQLIKGKGVDLLLHALSRVEVPFRGLIVGSGNAETDLRQLAETLHLGSRVEFRGWMNNEDLASIYDSARVVAVPIRWPEPFGLVGLEAMRHARPVVAFDIGGIPDWLEDGRTGFLVAQQDIAAFARALSKLLTDYDSARHFGEAGCASASERFGFDDYVEKLVASLLPGKIHFAVKSAKVHT